MMVVFRPTRCETFLLVRQVRYSRVHSSTMIYSPGDLCRPFPDVDEVKAPTIVFALLTEAIGMPCP